MAEQRWILNETELEMFRAALDLERVCYGNAHPHRKKADQAMKPAMDRWRSVMGLLAKTNGVPVELVGIPKLDGSWLVVDVASDPASTT